MNTSRSRIRYIIFLLPVVAVAIILRQYYVGSSTQGSGAHIVTFAHGPVIDRGPARGEAVYRLCTNVGAPPPVAFHGDASLLFDGVTGDCSTGYTTTDGGAATNTKTLSVLIDVGADAPPVRAWEVAGEFHDGAINTVTLSATDSPFYGVWPQIDHLASVGNGKISVTRSIVPTRYRYWLIQYRSAGAGASVRASDARLMDRGGHAIGSHARSLQADSIAAERRNFAEQMAPLRFTGRQEVR